MCGVLGIAGPEGAVQVGRLLADLTHRGPDDEGTWTSRELTLGHRRLAIIGLDQAGRQPMVSRSQESVIVFNGEIYNYLELADELESTGRLCDRRFDSAVLIEALEAWGVDALPKLNGMFSFAWYRPTTKRVLLARDRWGKKPLYWGPFVSQGGSTRLAFSSELRTFTSLPGGPPAPDPLGVARYLVYDGMPHDRTIYTNVRKVPAASWVIADLEGRAQRSGTYWRFSPNIGPVDVRAATERASASISNALDLRLRSDVPIGLFLSGGMDSSILAALLRRQHPHERIQTFTVGFEDPSYDERWSARLMAKKIGSEHHEIVLTGKHLEAGLQTVLERLPEPLGDPSIVPMSLLCNYAREHITVAISGDGGDELQAGYDPFRAWRTAEWMGSILPGRYWDRILTAAERLAPSSGSNMSLKFKLHHFRQGLPHKREDRVQAWLASFPVQRALAFLKPEMAESVDVEEILEPSRRAFNRLRAKGALHSQISAWLATYLECCILAKVDRASMLHSLEVRAPFLDPEVAESLTNLPPSLIFRNRRGKFLMRQIAHDLVPPQLLNKPKKGFGVPLTTWFKTTLRDRMEDAIARSRTEGWFRHEAVQKMWREHLSGKYDHRKALWNLLISVPYQVAP